MLCVFPEAERGHSVLLRDYCNDTHIRIMLHSLSPSFDSRASLDLVTSLTQRDDETRVRHRDCGQICRALRK